MASQVRVPSVHLEATTTATAANMQQPLKSTTCSTTAACIKPSILWQSSWLRRDGSDQKMPNVWDQHRSCFHQR